QMDVALLSTRMLSPVFTNDFALGLRHVRMGFRQFVPGAQTTSGEPAFLNTQALGLEVHAMSSYNVIFDPASSNLFVSLVAEAGQYSLFESPLFQDPYLQVPVLSQSAPEEGFAEEKYRGGVVWVRSGIEYNRPSYQFLPFLNVPLKQWKPREGNWHEVRIHIGFRLMLR